MKEKVLGIIKRISGTDNCEENMKLVEDVGFDSLLLVKLLIDIEDEFDIKLKQVDMDPYELKTVDSVITLVNKYVGDENE